jgi:hypothetical protein
MAAADCPNFLPFDLTGCPLEGPLVVWVPNSEAEWSPT